MSAFSSSFKRTAHNPRRIDKPWQLKDRIWKHYKHQATRFVSKMCSVWCPKKKSSCAQPLEWPFELGFTEKIPKILEDNSEHFQAFWETLFESERVQKRPEIYFRPKSFRTIFEKRTPVYSFAAPLLGLAKSIYYIINLRFKGKIHGCQEKRIKTLSQKNGRPKWTADSKER